MRSVGIISVFSSLLLLIISFVINDNVYAQCCSAGTNIGGFGNPDVLFKHTAKIASIVQHTYATDYYEGSKKSDRSYVDFAKYNFIKVYAAYGITPKLTIESESGYFLNKTQYYSYISPLEGNGLSNLAFIAKYQILNNESKQYAIVPGLGISIPIGPYQLKNENGFLLPIDLQPSTGAYSYIGTLFLYKGFIEKHIRLFFTSRIELNQRNPIEYKFGDIFISAIFMSYSIAPEWTIIFQLRNEYRKKDENTNGLISYSGSNKFFFTPQINYSIKNKWDLSIIFNKPVYQYYNDLQLANAYTFAISISRKIDFNNFFD